MAIGQTQDSEQLLQRAEADLQAGNAEEARTLVRLLLARQDRPEFHVLLGDCEEALGNFREAANQYQIAARADASESNLFAFGSELLKHGGYQEALQIATYAAKHYPQAARLRIMLGIAEYSTGRYHDAVATLCSAVDMNPMDPRPFEFLGRMIGVAPELSAKVTERLQHFSSAYPKSPAANYYYAMSLLAEPNTSSKLPRHLLERAVSEQPSFAEAHYQLALICDKEGDARRAVAELETAVQLRPGWKDAHYHLAQLYRKKGQTEMARREYEAFKNASGR